jgi:hypothetical protein
VSVANSLVIVCVLAATASAQTPQAAAVAKFDEGRAALKAGKYEEACAAFETSQKLDPQNGTLFNLAECSERLGKLATAWLAYRDLAQKDTLDGRKKESAKRAKALGARLPKLLIKVESPPAGMTVTINDKDSTQLVGIESPVDLGDYSIKATAPGYEPFESTESVTKEGKTVTVEIELDEKEVDGVPKKPKKAKKRTTPEEPVSHRKRNGVITAVAGGSVMAVGLVFGFQAKGSWDDARSICPDGACPGPLEKMAGDVLVDEARSKATTSTVLFLGGAAIMTAGIYFAATAKSPRSTTALIAPMSGGAELVLSGRF